MKEPSQDWLDFPEEFENPVDPFVEPTAWGTAPGVVKGRTIQIYVGPVKSPTLEVRKRGAHDRGMIGLWTGTAATETSRTFALRP